MKKYNAEKKFLTILQSFDLHICGGGGWGGVYCKPCLQPISCVFLFFVSDFNFEHISCGSRQYLLISSEKHVFVSPDSINGIKKTVTITLLFLQLK